jgi:hypothetical protein
MPFLWIEALRAGRHPGFKIRFNDLCAARDCIDRLLGKRVRIPATFGHPARPMPLGSVSDRAIEMSSLDDELFPPHISGNYHRVFGAVSDRAIRGRSLWLQLAIPCPDAAEMAALYPAWSPKLEYRVRVAGMKLRGPVISHVAATHTPAQAGLGQPVALSVLDRRLDGMELSTCGYGEREHRTGEAADRAARAVLSTKQESFARFRRRTRALVGE